MIKNSLNKMLFSEDSAAQQEAEKTGEPINLIEFGKEFKLNPKALDILYGITEEIIVVSIVGKARTGKSYLMNLLLDNRKDNDKSTGFKVASTINSCTKGIWIYNTPKQKLNSSAKILFIDSEGTNSVDLSTKTYDSKIFAIVILISSLFLYNTVGNIDEKSISELALAAHLSSCIATDLKSEEQKERLIEDLTPKFIWTLRDFTLEKINPETGEEISSDEYLELCLRNKTSGKNSADNNLIRANIIKYFKQRECVTLSRPVETEEELKNLNSIAFDDLKPNFKSEFLELKNKIYYESRPKMFGNKAITGPILADLVKAFVKSLNSGIVPNINTAWDDIILSEIDKKYASCKEKLRRKFDDLSLRNNSLTKDDFNLIDLREVYRLKFEALDDFCQILNEYKEIKHNKIYLDKYFACKKNLEENIAKSLGKVRSINEQKKQKVIRSNILKYQKILDLNMYNNSYRPETNFVELIKDYKTLLEKMSFDYCQSSSEIEKLVSKTDSNYTHDIIYYITHNLFQKSKEDVEKIEKEIQYNMFNTMNVKLEQVKIINQNLNKTLLKLTSESDQLEQEITEKIERYKNLLTQRDNINQLIADYRAVETQNQISYQNKAKNKTQNPYNVPSNLPFSVENDREVKCQIYDQCNIM